MLRDFLCERFIYEFASLIFMNKDKKFEALWKKIEAVRKDPEAMKLLDRLIKVHTS